MDITNELNNMRIGWINQAREERRLATLQRGQPPAGGWPEYNEQIELKALAHDREAFKLEKKAAAAAQGLYYEEVDDIKSIMFPENQELRYACLAAHRVVREFPLTDGTDMTALAKLQKGQRPIPDNTWKP